MYDLQYSPFHVQSLRDHYIRWDTSQEIAFMLIHGTGENNSDISAFKPILTKKTKYILKICKAKRNEYLQWCYNHH